MTPQTHHLQVSVERFTQGLHTLRKVIRRKSRAEALFSFDGENLCVTLEGASCLAPATGQWSGQARIESSFLKQIGMMLEFCQGETVEVTIDGDKLVLGTLKLPCQFDPQKPQGRLLPLGATLLDKLALLHQYPRSHLMRIGLTPVIDKAEKEREWRLARAATLLEPLGFTREELAQWVEEKARKRSGGHKGDCE